MRVGLGLLLFFFSGVIHAEPKTIYREDVLYRFNFSSRQFDLIWDETKLGLLSLYTRWDNSQDKLVWVTKDNRDPIVTGTKVEGWRLGYEGKNYLNWFSYTAGGAPAWTKDTRRIRPAVWRYSAEMARAGSPTNGIYRAEQAHEEWESFGGELDAVAVKPVDPPVVVPPEKPPVVVPPVVPPAAQGLSCKIEANPENPKAGETVLLTLRSFGPVTSATLDGAGVDFPIVVRARVFEKAGPHTVKGSVSGAGNTRADCSIDLKVGP